MCCFPVAFEISGFEKCLVNVQKFFMPYFYGLAFALMQLLPKVLIHICHISYCEIKSHRIWPIWKAIPIKDSNLAEFSDHYTTVCMKK